MTEALLLAVIALLVMLVVFIRRRAKVEPDDVASAVSSAWMKLGLDEKVGMITAYARDIRDNYRSLEQMLRVPTERGSLGEMALEAILADQLPPGMFGIREKVLDGRIPDACIRSSLGIICIDSKFPLDNYRRVREAADSAEREGYKKDFLRDVNGHLAKTARDYVCPDKGSADFAFAYIPSEGVHWFLVTEALELLRDYAKRGVQVVSPLTLTQRIELIKAGVNARKLSEEAEKVKAEIILLSRGFEAIDDKWRVFYQTHVRNLGNKADEVDAAYRKLREEFDRVTRLPGE